MSIWGYNELFNKSKLFIRKALEHEDPTSFEVPFWSIISLELLARSTLSKINPALLADPREGANILFACGFPSDKSPVSIPAKALFLRCKDVCPEFTSKEYEQCMIWINYRNEELHTGALRLQTLKTSEWMPEFFRIVKILLDFNVEALDNYVGAKNIEYIKTMIKAVIDNKKSEVYSLIKKAKEEFDRLDVEIRLEKIKSSKEKRTHEWLSRYRGQEIDCPACGGAALVTGELIRSTTPKDDGEGLAQEDVILPNKLKCYSCSLELNSHEQLHAIGMGSQYIVKDYLDPRDYYGIEVSPQDDVDFDYGND